MFKKLVAVSFTFVLVTSIAGAADTTQTRANISAAEIVNKNIEARGGLQAWRSVQTMSMEGKLGVGGNQRAPVPEPLPGKKMSVIPTDQRPKDEVQLPFTMELQRLRKERFELLFNGKKALQVFDGVNGWKLRPYLNRLEVEPYTPDELKIASTQAELDGYLVDYASKGSRVELDGMEKVEDHDTYKLRLTMKDGHAIHVWIDAQTFLEAKVEGQPRRLDGVEHPVEVYYRDYRIVRGLRIPFVLETSVLPVAKAARLPGVMSGPVPSEKIVIDKVEVNPKLDASLFEKPRI
jgi:hypothetical protein